ncbi:Omp28-related outer membrane protein [uncultured Prevotella sp.]|uniref:Omp28-related outer membrane protein n=1 Tax=uncultured Prevotella sp. TaxID=159272 RepID=UPI0026279CC7|nr:Omp28-related outer membrane protein [uncultured Prevotella sp.]
MKKIIISLLALFALTQAGNAQVSGMNIGYCNGLNGTYPSTSDDYFANASTKKNTWTKSAILLSEDRLKTLAGNQIREINAALASKLNVDSLVVWVSESLDGKVLSADTITTMTKGWNTVALKEAVDITSDMKRLYVGYSYHQKSTCKALATLSIGVPGYSCFMCSGDGEWTDKSENLTTCVEAVVYGDNLPKYDLALQNMSVQDNYVIDNGKLNLTLLVRNNATVTISSFDAVCSIEGIDEKYTAHITGPIAYNEEKSFDVTIEPKAIQTMDPAKRNITVTIDNLAEGKDERMSDNSKTGLFNITLHSYERQVLLEEFTTEKCTNCPRVASFVHDVMNDPEFEGRLHTMENHAGYYTDSFTTTFHNDWLWFFDNVYAPGVMYDRTADEGNATAVSCPSVKRQVYEIVRKALRQTAFVSLKITAHVDTENQKIDVKVSGSRAKKDFTRNPARITVVLTETNLDAISQAGASADIPYIHYNVGRRVNSTWGDVIEWNGDDYTYECSIPYNQDYVMDNLGILAFVHDYDAEDKTKCEVANSAAITAADFTGITLGIDNVKASVKTPMQIFDLSGRKLTQLRHGVNIVVKDGKTCKIVK